MPDQDIKVEIEGLRRLQRKLRRMGSKRRQKSNMRSVITAGATVMRKELRQIVKSDEQRTGSLLDAVDHKVKVYQSGRAFAAVGVRRGSKATYYDLQGNKVVPAKYFHLVDLGTAPHDVAGRRHPGAKAKQYRRKVVQRARLKAFRAMRKRAEKRIIAEAKRG